MKDRIDKIRNDVKTNIFNKSVELVIVGLRTIELLEELLEQLKKEGEKNGRRSDPEPRPKREYTRRKRRTRSDKGKPKPNRLAGVPASGTEG